MPVIWSYPLVINITKVVSFVISIIVSGSLCLYQINKKKLLLWQSQLWKTKNNNNSLLYQYQSWQMFSASLVQLTCIFSRKYARQVGNSQYLEWHICWRIMLFSWCLIPHRHDANILASLAQWGKHFLQNWEVLGSNPCQVQSVARSL